MKSQKQFQKFIKKVKNLGGRIVEKLPEKREQLAPKKEAFAPVEARRFGKAIKTFAGKQKGRIIFAKKTFQVVKGKKQVRYLDVNNRYVSVKQ